jgi:hypothetical protein
VGGGGAPLTATGDTSSARAPATKSAEIAQRENIVEKRDANGDPSR